MEETSKSERKIKSLPMIQISRDEMNLAEFPLTILSTRSNPNIKTLEFRDTIIEKNGREKQRSWIITGADKFGLPTASDDEVLLGLLKLTVDEGLQNQKVFFTRYELLRILKWTTEGRSYSRLQNALDRLSGIRIKATNAFYDNETKLYSTKNFGIIDAYEINDGRDVNLKPSFFIWSEELFKSFQSGFIKKLDLDYYLKLRSAISKRLYRFLDKHFWYKSKVKLNLFILAHEKIGISRNYSYTSSLRQQLDPAIEELIASGFLAGCDYVGKGKNTEIVFYSGTGKPNITDKNALKASNANKQQQVEFNFETNYQQNIVKEEKQDLKTLIANKLLNRGIKAGQLNKLLTEDQVVLERVNRIIDHFDKLIANKSVLIKRSPIGFLYRAVEKPFNFILPDDEISKRHAINEVVKPKEFKLHNQKNQLQFEYEKVLENRLREVRSEIEPTTLINLEKEIKDSLMVLRSKGAISSGKYEKTVSQMLDQRLIALFALPSYDEWLKEKDQLA